LDEKTTILLLLKKVEELTKRVKQLEEFEKDNKILRHENTLLKAENTELKVRLNSNSSNSSKPPSSDGYKKKPALPKPILGKQGGQTGHKGQTLKQIKDPDKIIKCMPGECSCGHEFKNAEFVLSETRQVFDLPQPRLEVTEYQIHKTTCPICGLIHKGTAPEGVNSPVQYGNNVKAYVVLLNVHFKLPFKKIQLLFGDLFGYTINESTVYSASQQCYKKLEKSEQLIKTKIANGDVTHADETGVRVEGKLQWLHTATSSLYTYFFVHEKRGGTALKSDKSILVKITGWLVHDCWGSYFNFMKLKHAICGAHILTHIAG